MFTLEDLNNNSLHHAYLIEGQEDRVLPELLLFIESLKVKTLANPDFSFIKLDTFKIEDVRNLKKMVYDKAYGDGKKVFIILANNFLLEAQNALLKIFEEPIDNTLFFLIISDVDQLLKTLVSRFYFISAKQSFLDTKDAGKFLKMNLKDRIDFVKEMLVETENEEEIKLLLTPRSKATNFLNTLEASLHSELISKRLLDTEIFNHLFKVREFLNQPGASIKNLMESEVKGVRYPFQVKGFLIQYPYTKSNTH